MAFFRGGMAKGGDVRSPVRQRVSTICSISSRLSCCSALYSRRFARYLPVRSVGRWQCGGEPLSTFWSRAVSARWYDWRSCWLVLLPCCSVVCLLSRIYSSGHCCRWHRLSVRCALTGGCHGASLSRRQRGPREPDLVCCLVRLLS